MVTRFDHFSSSDNDTYRVKEYLEVLPHTSDYQEDLINCDEFGYELIPIHSENWYERRERIWTRDRNKQLLDKGQELLSYLKRQISVDNDSLACLALAITKELTDDDGLGSIADLISDVNDHSQESSDEWYPEPVHGIMDSYGLSDVDGYHRVWASKYNVLPDISGYARRRAGLSDIRVPTNTDLSETVIAPTHGKSLEDIWSENPRFGGHTPRVLPDPR